MAVRLSALRAGLPLHSPPPGRFLVLSSVTGYVDLKAIVRLEGLGRLKNPMTSSGLEPATFRLVAQCLNQLRNFQNAVQYTCTYTQNFSAFIPQYKTFYKTNLLRVKSYLLLLEIYLVVSNINMS
jgi:hypothetical protein